MRGDGVNKYYSFVPSLLGFKSVSVGCGSAILAVQGDLVVLKVLHFSRPWMVRMAEQIKVGLMSNILSRITVTSVHAVV